MIKFLKAAPVVFLIGTIVTGILYQKTLLEIWLTIAITFGTTAYHFIMRWVVAFIYNSIMHNRADYRKHWYQVSKSEMKLYEKLRVKKWKNCMPQFRLTCDLRYFLPGVLSRIKQAGIIGRHAILPFFHMQLFI